MRTRLFLAFSLAFTFIGVQPSQAEEKPQRHYLMSCSSTPDVECIEYITATSPTGKTLKVTAPSRIFQTRDDLNPVDTAEEWSFPGFTFEGSAANRVVPRFVFRPLGAEQCAFGICIEGIEELQIGISASWLNVTPEEEVTMQMDLSRRGSQLLCGDKNQPRTCRRSFNFNQEMRFEVSLRMPVDFEPAAILGSVKDLVFVNGTTVEKFNGVNYRKINLKFSSQLLQKALFSNFVPNPMKTSDYADYEGDAINFWLLGKRSSQVSSLGQCASTPFITVLSNSVYQSLPRWNQTTQSIEVDLQAPHFGVNGTIHKGYFEATISKEMGKCLWRIDLGTKSEAKMSITYSTESGQEIQTVSGKFDGENYILFAANFHYSSPKISFKLQNIQPVEVKPVEVKPVEVKPVEVKPKIKSVVCTKGKLKKTVKGVAPKCPTGYKKS